MSPSKSGVAFGDLQDTIITPKGIEYDTLLQGAENGVG